MKPAKETPSPGGSYKRGLEQARLEYEKVLAHKIAAAIAADRKAQADAEAAHRAAAMQIAPVYREIILPCAEEPSMPVHMLFPSTMGVESKSFVLDALTLIFGRRAPTSDASGR